MTASPEIVVDKRWLWALRIGAVVFIGLMLLAPTNQCGHTSFDLHGPSALTTAVLLPYVVILWRLILLAPFRNRARFKRGLELAVWYGVLATTVTLWLGLLSFC